VMSNRPRLFDDKPPRSLVVRVLGGFLVSVAFALPAQAALLPAGFFNMDFSPGQGAAAVEADTLSYDGRTSTISAEGDVMLAYAGISIRADRLRYNQATGELHAV